MPNGSTPDVKPDVGAHGGHPWSEPQPKGNGADHDAPKRPEWFTKFWASLDEVQRWNFDEAWTEGGECLNHEQATDACILICRNKHLTLDQTVRVAEFFPDTFGKLANYCALIHRLWAQQLRDEAKAKAEADAEQKEADRLAKILIVSDEPWDPATLPDRPWLAPPYLMRDEITLLHGPGGHGKSQLLVVWAVAMALGRQYGRLRPKQRCRIILTNFEDNAVEQMRRISAALEYFGATPTDLVGWLFRVSLGPIADATMFELDEFGSVHSTETWDALQALCVKYRPDGVALDPLVAINAVPERDNQLMRRVMVIIKSEIADRYHVAVMLAHHDNKGGGDSETNDQNNARGGGDIVNAARFELACKKMTAAQADQMGVRAERRGFYFRVGSVDSKVNYSAPEPSEWFERLAVVVGNEQVVRCLPWEPPTGRLTDEQTKAVIAAIEKGTKDGPYSPQLGNTGRSLAPVLAGLGITIPKAQKQALDELVNSGAVVKAKWKQPGKGNDAHAGLRSAARLPYQWEWCDAADDE